MENFTRELKSVKESSQLKIFPKEILGLEIFIGEFLKKITIKVQIMLILHKFFYRLAKEGTLSNSFCMVSITLIPKPNKDIKRKNIC